MKKTVEINAIEKADAQLEQARALINMMHHECISERQVGMVSNDMEVLFTILLDLNISTHEMLSDVIEAAYSAEG